MERSLGKVERGVLAGSGAFSHLGRSIAFASGAFLGAAGFTQVVKDSIGAANELGDQIDRTRAVFGNASKAVVAWSTTSAGSLGIARDEALKAAGTFGEMQKAVGLVGPQAAQMSTRLVDLAGNLAAIHHVDPSDVFARLEAGLRGRGQGLVQYGIKLSSATLAEEAFREGLVKSTVDQQKVADAQQQVAIAEAKLADARKRYGAGTTQVAEAEIALRKAQEASEKAAAGTTAKLNDQQKTAAALGVIFRQTADQAGYLSKHQDDLDFQTRKLHAELKGAEATIGQALLPTVTALVSKLADWIDRAQRTGELQRDVNTAMRVAKQVIGDVTAVVVPFAKGADHVAHALGGWKTTLEGVLALGVASKVAGMALAFDGLAASEGAAATGALGLLNNLKALRLVELPAAVLSVGARGETGTKTLKGWSYLGGRWYQTDASAKVSDLPAGASYVDLHGHAGVTAGAAVAPSPFVGAAASVAGGRGIQLPTSQTATHQTAGLPGFPAVDIMAKPGTPIGAPEDGIITRISGHEPTEAPPQGQGGPWGLSIYFLGTQTGNTYYMTHLVKVAPPGRYRRGDVIGLIGDYPGSSADHVHFAIHQGDSPEAHYGSSLFNPADYLARPQGGSAASASTATASTAAAAAAAGMPPPAGGGGLRVGTTPSTPPTRPAVPVIPDALANAYLAAQIAGDQQAQLRILEKEKAALEAERKHPKFGQTVGDILDALLGVNDAIAQWHKDQAAALKDEAAKVKAATLKQHMRMAAAIRETGIEGLNALAGIEHTAAAAYEKASAENARGVAQSARATIAGLNDLGRRAVLAGARAEVAAFQKANRGPIVPGYAATSSAVAKAAGIDIPQMGFDTPAPQIGPNGQILPGPVSLGADGSVIPPPPAKLAPAWGTFKREEVPTLGKILIPLALLPRVHMWEKLLATLKKKLAAGVQRQKALQRDLAKAKGLKIPNSILVSDVGKRLVTAGKVVANIKQDIATCVAELKDLGQTASSAVQEAAQEAEAAAAQDAAQAAQSAATDAPPADSGDTGGGSDLGGSGGGGSSDSSGTDSTAQDAAAAAAAAQSQAQAEQQRLIAQTDSWLAGIYAIRPFQSNLLPEPGQSRFGGAHITINQYYKGPPEDPHSYSQALEFELRALGA